MSSKKKPGKKTIKKILRDYETAMLRLQEDLISKCEAYVRDLASSVKSVELTSAHCVDGKWHWCGEDFTMTNADGTVSEPQDFDCVEDHLDDWLLTSDKLESRPTGMTSKEAAILLCIRSACDELARTISYFDLYVQPQEPEDE